MLPLIAKRLIQLPFIVLAVYTITFVLAWLIPAGGNVPAWLMPGMGMSRLSSLLGWERPGLAYFGDGNDPAWLIPSMGMS